MVYGSHPVAFPVYPAAVLPTDLKLGIDEPLGGRSRPKQTMTGGCSSSVSQRRNGQAGFLRLRRWIPIAWRMTFDNIGHVNILPPQLDRGQQQIQHAAGRPHKRNSLLILLAAGRFCPPA